MILPSPPPTHGLPPSTPVLTSPPPTFTPPHPKLGTEAWPSPTPSSLQPPLSAQAHYPTPPFMPPPRPPLDKNRVAPPPPTHSFVDGLGYTVVKALLSGGGGVWPNMGQSRKNFVGGNDKVLRSFDHIFNVEFAEALRRTPELPQRWQSKCRNSTALTWGFLRKVVERLPTHIWGVRKSSPHDPSPRDCVAGYG